MALILEAQERHQTLLAVARQMMTAARTAPKARGVDNLEIGLLDKPELELLARKMVELVERGMAAPFFERDAANLLAAEAAVLIGTKIHPMGLKYCGLCGFSDCGVRDGHPDTPCVFNTGDLGIAVGSAVSVAMEARVDNRIMYSAGMAARDLKLLGDDIQIIYCIPLSCTGKNPFFDRK
jgi:uncharacterized ferredoxin-like protein